MLFSGKDWNPSFFHCPRSTPFLAGAAGRELLNTENRTLLLERYAKPGGWYEVRGTAPGCRVFLAGKLTGGELAILLSNGEEGAESVYQQLLQLKGAPKWQ